MRWEFNHELTKKPFARHEELNMTNLLFEEEEIEQLFLNFETIRGTCFKKCKLSSVTIENAFLGKVKFQNCELNNVVFSASSLSQVDFDNSKLINVTFFESTLSDINIIESIIEYSKIENSKMANAKWDDVKLMENIHRHNKYENTEFYKCHFISDNFIDTRLKECDLRTCHFDMVKINLDELITSKLSILNLLELVNDKGIIIEE